MSSNPSDDDKSEVLLSCRYGDLEDVQDYVNKFGAPSLTDVRDENKNTILHMICANGHLDLLSYLLPLVSSELLSAQNVSGSTPLHWAALNTHLDIAKKLVLFDGGPGRDLIDIKNNAGLSPLGEAEIAGWDEGAKWFVEVMNLESEGSKEEEEATLDTEDRSNREIEVEIEDADGQIAKMTISGSTPNAASEASVS
ncbi:Ankyrin repeat-containing protein P16F5.05c [Psilocybe cubensis]|uniref:Ankyrin repeat-containing protein P16F5.05c n=2 Tax=Psilocybe cubensis TaxID=181762 RepID=A0ACB8HD93_PSICU|nr:Ankyrin repeat-containing protein P16F5.05c [Psilocybe cubensis]KAH9485622.1 Ankyrin repeat-containing protein P16F5.05c [Psilocybe cubensis]